MLELAPETPVDGDALAAWLEPIVSIARLASAPYGDGDAWTHTRTAMQRLVNSDAYVAYAPEARRIVATATAVHAAGCAHVTPHGSFTAKSDTLARAALWRSDVPFGMREHVCALVRHHQVPLRGLDAADPARLARWLSLIVDHDWLVTVAHAIAPSDTALLWREHCDELGILGTAQRFPTPHTKICYLESPSRLPEVVAHDDTTCEVIAMAGLPATGKSTWLAEQARGLPVVSLDDLRIDLEIDPADGQGAVLAAAHEHARAHLRDHEPFVWNATNLLRLHRTQLGELVRGYRGRLRIVYCETTAAEQDRRNRERAARVPAAAVRRMIERWTVPDPSEAHEVTYVVPSEPDDVAWPPC